MTPEAIEEGLAEDNPYLLEPKKNWIHFGNSDVLRKIVKSNIFYTTYVVGQQGAGKTELLLQLHAEEKKPVILVSITPETDEDDLIGSLSLTVDPVTGQTITGWEDGPVLIAMKNGYSLILDEVDTGGNLQSLFPVLTGQSIFVKRIKQRVVPKKGFNVFATANTRGKGSVDGRFTSAQVQSVAFVDRFKAMIEQDYPDAATEIKILTGCMGLLDEFGVQVNMSELVKVVKLLVEWAAKIRQSFKTGSVEETLSTRKLISIIEGLAVFESFEKSIEVNLNSLDPDTAKAFQTALKTLSTDELKTIDRKLFSRHTVNSNQVPPINFSRVEEVRASVAQEQLTNVLTNSQVPPQQTWSQTNDDIIDRLMGETDTGEFVEALDDDIEPAPAPVPPKTTKYLVL